MPRRLVIQPHLSLDELDEIERRYRQATDATQRTHYQVIWLLAQGKTSTEVATVTGYGKSWIYELVRSYNRTGPEMLGDQRKKIRVINRCFRMCSKLNYGKRYRKHQPMGDCGMVLK